ncbi:MAG TPA: DUF4064 domain-containing protein [Bacillota bacterium]|nr:DUF4064 domain-containing protein [Bacillota bacterium]
MKRTTEMILSIIGMFLYFCITAIGGFYVWMTRSEEMMEKVREQMLHDQGLAASEIDEILQVAGPLSWMITIGGLLAIILGIVAMIMLKGNKNPKAAGITLLVVGAATILIAFPHGIFIGMFYLIAGILCLARKPRPSIDSGNA